MSNSNGHSVSVSSDATQFVLTPKLDINIENEKDDASLTQDLTTFSKKLHPSRSTKKPNNKAVPFHLDIDAGSHNVKAMLNGEYKVFQSVAKVIESDVPLRDNGCFSYGKQSYVVGRAIERVNGTSIVNANDHKLNSLTIWILGALTHYRKQLRSLVENRRRKTEPARIDLSLRILTLSSIKRTELKATLKQISKFQWDDFDIEINVKNIEFVNEAFGAALEVVHTHKVEEFCLLDLGGGTLTYSQGYWDGYEVSTSQQPISGAGIVKILNLISTALSRTDRGATGTNIADIQLALEASRSPESVKLRASGVFIEISAEVKSALDDWVRGNNTVKELFDRISQDLVRGNAVFCTGGGFAIPIIGKWIITYLTNGFENDANINVLDQPEKINMTGMLHLQENSK